MKTQFLFQMLPFIAFGLFGTGMAVRFILTRQPSGDVFVRSRLFQLSLLLLFLGHLAGMVLPEQILLWNSIPFRLYVLESSAFASGLAALAGWTLLMLQHLRTSSESVARQIADTLFMSSVFVALLSGSLTAVLYRWGSSWGVLTLTPYAISLLKGQPAVGLVTGMPLLVRLHIVSAFASLALFPATRLAVVPIVGLTRGLRLIVAPASVAVDSVGRLINTAAQRLNPAAWIWPEED